MIDISKMVDILVILDWQCIVCKSLRWIIHANTHPGCYKQHLTRQTISVHLQPTFSSSLTGISVLIKNVMHASKSVVFWYSLSTSHSPVIQNELIHCSLETPKRVKGRMRHLIRVFTVCKQFNHFSLGISKSHNLTYLKSKLESSHM